MATVGECLRTERLSAGWSLNDLAAATGINKSHLSRYENGHVTPSLQSLCVIARTLDLPVARLLKGIC